MKNSRSNQDWQYVAGRMLTYFLYQEDKTLNKIEFEIPVKIQKGSWMAIIPENIGEWVKFAIGTGLTTYALAGAKKNGG